MTIGRGVVAVQLVAGRLVTRSEIDESKWLCYIYIKKHIEK